MKKETVKMRFWGLVIVPLMIIVFKNLYSLTNGALLGIFFGAVNGSMWAVSYTHLTLPTNSRV